MRGRGAKSTKSSNSSKSGESDFYSSHCSYFSYLVAFAEVAAEESADEAGGLRARGVWFAGGGAVAEDEEAE